MPLKQDHSRKGGSCSGHIDLPALVHRVIALHAFRGEAGLQGQRFKQSPLGSQRESARCRLETMEL